MVTLFLLTIREPSCISHGSHGQSEASRRYTSVFLYLYLLICIRRGIYYRIGWPSHGSLEVPWFAVCKLGTRNASGVIQSKSEGLGTWRTDVWGQERMGSQLTEQVHPPSDFLFDSDPRWVGRCPPTLVRAIFFAQSISSYANLF